jgi:FMN phosphatase YigB (HAD superfamily)
MPLFNETLDSIAQAIVTVKLALKEGVIEEENYKGLNDYLAKRAKDFKIKKSHITRANKNLDDELETEAQEFMDEGDALRGWAEELLEEHERDLGKDDDEMLREEEMNARDRFTQNEACMAFLKELRA